MRDNEIPCEKTENEAHNIQRKLVWMKGEHHSGVICLFNFLLITMTLLSFVFNLIHLEIPRVIFCHKSQAKSCEI